MNCSSTCNSRGLQSCFWILFYNKQYNLLQRTQHILELKEEQMMIYALSLEQGHHASRGKLKQHPFVVVFTVQPLRFMVVLLERQSAALTGLDEEVSDGSTVMGCWSEKSPAEQSPGTDLMPSGATEGSLLPLLCWVRVPDIQTQVLWVVVIPEEKWTSGLLRKKENAASED